MLPFQKAGKTQMLYGRRKQNETKQNIQSDEFMLTVSAGREMTT